MPIELKIPEVGESITEVQIAEWLKHEGDEVKTDENVAVIDSEKATFELPAPVGGRITRILHQAGDTVKVGEAIAELDADREAGKTQSAPVKKEHKTRTQPGPQTESGTKRDKKPEKKPAPLDEITGQDFESGKTKAQTPQIEVKQEATELRETGHSPEVTPKDAAAEKPIAVPESEAAGAPAIERGEEVVPMTMLRRTAARRLVEAHQTMAMLTTFNELDMSAVRLLRTRYAETFENRYHAKLGLMSFFVKASIDALKQFPKLNAEIRGTDIVYRNYFDIGVAIATERGLVVPVLRGAERLSFAEVEKEISDLAQRARVGKLKPDELEGGTFTITNGGVFGSLLSTPIINPPQTGILGMHAIQDRPVAIEGRVVIQPMMYVALTYDHRLVDGRDAVLFLRRVKDAIQNPARMLIEI